MKYPRNTSETYWMNGRDGEDKFFNRLWFRKTARQIVNDHIVCTAFKAYLSSVIWHREHRRCTSFYIGL